MPVTTSALHRPGRGFRAVLTDADRFPFSAPEQQRMSAAGVELVELAGHASGDVLQAVRGSDAVFVYSAELSRDVLAGFGSCRLVVRCGAGYDRIDVAAARDMEIRLSYVPAYGSWDVAEHTLALMFAVARRLPYADRSVRAGQWPSAETLGPMHRLRGNVLGLVGFGRIAQRVAKVATALGMTVCAFDPFAPDDLFTDAAVTRVTLTELSGCAQVISLHAPLTASTIGIIDRTFLSRIRPGAILINTARGELVDQPALVQALMDGRMAGAGLDVLTQEPPDLHDPLLGLPTVVLTPHSAAFTEEALASVRSQAIDEVLRAASGQSPKNLIPEPKEPDRCGV